MSKDKEFVIRRSIFNTEKERLLSSKVDDDDVCDGARGRKRREHQSEKRRRSPFIGEDLVSNDMRGV